jgi:hypothetical protein
MKLKVNLLVIKDVKDHKIEINPLMIKDIKFDKTQQILKISFKSKRKTMTLNKDNYDYTEWIYLLNVLQIIYTI